MQSLAPPLEQNPPLESDFSRLPTANLLFQLVLLGLAALLGWLGIVRALVEQGVTVVSVLHEVSMALHADAVVIMTDGRVLHHGAAHHPDTHANVEAVFGGRLAIHSVAGQWVVLPRPAIGADSTLK